MHPYLTHTRLTRVVGDAAPNPDEDADVNPDVVGDSAGDVAGEVVSDVQSGDVSDGRRRGRKRFGPARATGGRDAGGGAVGAL